MAGDDPRGCVTDGYIKLNAPVIHSTVLRNYPNSDGISTACELEFSAHGWWSVQDAAEDFPQTSIRHTFTLDHTATSTPIKSPPSKKRKFSSENSLSEKAQKLPTSILSSTEVVEGDDVLILIVAHTIVRQSSLTDVGRQGVWALVLKRADHGEQSYKRVGIIWPPLNSRNPLQQHEGEKSCDLFDRTKLQFNRLEKSIIVIV
jgi:hypothetical protein